uniref:DUF599 family protein n=1 Tax=Zea mays TaxID=4577 RepID=A0A804UDW9_MAIZE
MEWRDSFLDLALIPLSLLLPMAYHAWLWREVRLRPLRTAVGINAATRRLWAIGMMKDNAKNAVTVVQSVRNVIMGSTLMATTAILFCTGVAAVLSSTYTIKKPLSDTVFGAHGEYMMALKDYIGDVLERGFTLNLVGNRLFYAGVPLLLWIFGPLLAFLSSMVMVPILYSLDVVNLMGHSGCVVVSGKSAEMNGGSECARAV